MIRVVIDTNVLVSSTLSPKGNSAQIMHLVSDKQIVLSYSSAILEEYKRVLAYKRLNIAFQTQGRIIFAIEGLGVLIEPFVSDMSLPDETDRVFYDTAKECGAILITGNIRNYPSEDFIMTPAQFLSYIKDQ